MIRSVVSVEFISYCLYVYSSYMQQTLEEAILCSARNQQARIQLFMPGHVLYVDERETAT